MLNRDYFERVLTDQVRGMGGRARLQVFLDEGTALEVRAVVVAYETYVILEVYPKRGSPPERSPDWQKENPSGTRWVFDQVALPYEGIQRTKLTAQDREPGEPERPTGFRVAGGRGEGG